MRQTVHLKWCCSAPADEFLEKPETEVEEIIYSNCGGEHFHIFVAYSTGLGSKHLKFHFKVKRDKHQHTKILSLIDGKRSG